MGELLALQWRDIDYAGEAICVRRSCNVHGGVGSPKSGKVRGVPMVPEVASALARLADGEFWVEPEDLVFINELGTFRHSDIQTTMRYVHHRDRGDEAKLLAEAFRPAGTFGDVPRKRP